MTIGHPFAVGVFEVTRVEFGHFAVEMSQRSDGTCWGRDKVSLSNARAPSGQTPARHPIGERIAATAASHSFINTGLPGRPDGACKSEGDLIADRPIGHATLRDMEAGKAPLSRVIGDLPAGVLNLDNWQYSGNQESVVNVCRSIGEQTASGPLPL